MNKALVILLLAGLLAQTSALASSGEELLKAKGCVACHAIDRQVLGPPLQKVAAKYGAEGAAAISHSILTGSKNAWGPIPMPANAVSEEDAKTLAEWIVTLK